MVDGGGSSGSGALYAPASTTPPLDTAYRDDYGYYDALAATAVENARRRARSQQLAAPGGDAGPDVMGGGVQHNSSSSGSDEASFDDDGSSGEHETRRARAMRRRQAALLASSPLSSSSGGGSSSGGSGSGPVTPTSFPPSSSSASLHPSASAPSALQPLSEELASASVSGGGVTVSLSKWAPPTAAAGGQASRQLVLVADDVEMNRMVFARMLDKLAVDYHTAIDGSRPWGFSSFPSHPSPPPFPSRLR